MKALITGGAGFIGSHLAEALLKKGHSVVVLDDLSTGSMSNIQPLKQYKQFTLSVGSVMDYSLVKELVDSVEVVFHLAAAVGVKLIVQQPVRTILTNIRGTEHVLAAASFKLKKVILTSSSEVYGKGTHAPFQEEEDMVLGPTIRSRWSYACSKAIDEFLALAYWKEKKLPTAVARLFNTIGPRQTGQYGMVVPRFVQQALASKPICVYGNGRQRRVFSYITDVVQALIAMAEKQRAIGKIFNVGGTKEISILNLAKKIKQLTRSASPIRFVPYDQAYQPGFEDLVRRVPDISKAQQLLGYQPKVTLDQALRLIIQSFKANA